MAMDINGLNSNQTNTGKARSGPKVDSAKVSNSPASDAMPHPKGETVNISTEGQTLNRLSQQLDSDTPVNQEKVEALRAAIAEGRYKVDAEAVAGKMLESDALF